MSLFENWANSRRTAVGRTCMEAARECAKALPQPYNYISYLGYGFRRKRLENELLEFGFRYRIAKGAPVTCKQLVFVGNFLIGSNGGSLPAKPMPIDEELFVNQQTMPLLLHWLEKRNGEVPEQSLQ